MDDDVQVLLAVYNGEKYLEEQLDSLFRQTHRRFRVTVRDNHSTDGTRRLLRRWQGRHPGKIELIEGDRNLGVIGNFAALLDKADAPYVMLSDADDVWLPDKMEKTLKSMREAERACGKAMPVLVHTDLRVVDETLSLLQPSFWRMSKLDGSAPCLLNRALTENAVSGCTAMLNRALVELARPIPAEVPMHDAWIGLVAAAFGNVVPLTEATVLYRQHGNNAAGASAYGLFNYRKKLASEENLEKIAAIRRKRLAQAEAFRERFHARLSKEQLRVVGNYLQAHRTNRLLKGVLLWRHGFLESGLWRRLFQLFL